MKFTSEKRSLETTLSCHILEIESFKRRLEDMDEIVVQRKKLKVDLEKATSESAQFKGAFDVTHVFDSN